MTAKQAVRNAWDSIAHGLLILLLLWLVIEAVGGDKGDLCETRTKIIQQEENPNATILPECK